MPYNAEPGEVAYVTFTKACTHGDLVTESGFVGVAVKQQTPAADALRSTRNQIAVNEKGLLLISNVAEVPNTGALASPTKGQMVYIVTSSNALATTSNSGANLVVGKIASLPGERGTPSNRVRINLRQKVA